MKLPFKQWSPKQLQWYMMYEMLKCSSKRFRKAFSEIFRMAKMTINIKKMAKHMLCRSGNHQNSHKCILRNAFLPAYQFSSVPVYVRNVFFSSFFSSHQYLLFMRIPLQPFGWLNDFYWIDKLNAHWKEIVRKEKSRLMHLIRHLFYLFYFSFLFRRVDQSVRTIVSG